jgi:opacity protein-like surface antigen
MKKMYALAAFITFFSAAHAQIKSGDIVLGGNLGYDNQGSSSPQIPGSVSPTSFSKGNDLSFNPSVGKAIKENLVLGIDLSYTHSSFSGNVAGSPAATNSANGFLVGVFIRRYKPLGNGFSLFGQAEVAGSYSHNRSVDPTTDGSNMKENVYFLTFQLYAGIAYALNRRWQLEVGIPNFLSIDYNHVKSNTTYTNGVPDQVASSHLFSLASALTNANQISVGIRYFIGGK